MSETAQPPAAPATPPPTPSPTPPPATPPATPDRSDAVRKAAQFLATRIIDPKKKEEAKPAEQEKKSEEPKKPDEKKAETPATPPAEPKPKKAPREELTPERIAEISANTAAALMRQQRKEETPPPKKEKPVDLPLPAEMEAQRYIYERLERTNPKKYSGLINKLSAYAQKETDYIDQWVADNPGREFDPDDPSHDEFYHKNQPKVDPNDVRAAEVEHTKESVRNEVMNELRPELDEIRQNKARQSIAPKVQTAATSVIAEVLSGINPEYAKHINDAKKLTEIEAEDPLASDVARAVASEFVPLATEVVALYNGVPFNEKNNAHMALYQMAKQMEDAVQSLPPSQQLHEGRPFATVEEYSQMTKAEQLRHWTINEESLLYAISEQAKSKSAAIYQHEKGKLERYTKKNGTSSVTNGAPTTESTPAPEPKREAAPAVIPGRSVTPGTGNPSTPQSAGYKKFLERMGIH